MTFADRDIIDGLDIWPWEFWINMINRHWRDAAPIINAGVNITSKNVRGEIWWNLNVHFRQNNPSHGHSFKKITVRWGSRFCHIRFRFGIKVLHYDLLNMTVSTVNILD